MQNIQTVSQITTDDLYDYLRIAEKDTDTTNLLSTLLTVAKVYVGEYTGRTIQDIDNYRDIIICVLVLVQDMYDNRTLYVDKGNVNKVVESILGLHSVNLL
jgi:Mor family transcriptional regulator